MLTAVAMDARGGQCNAASSSSSLCSMPITEYACYLQDTLVPARSVRANNGEFVNVEVTFQAMHTEGDSNFGAKWWVRAHGRLCLLVHEHGKNLGPSIQEDDTGLLHNVRLDKDEYGAWTFVYIDMRSALIIRVDEKSDPEGVIDLGCGIGFLSYAATLCGFRPLLAVDNNQHMVDMYNFTHDGCRAILGDINSFHTIAKISMARAAGISLGISCQPYAEAGKKLGLDDKRDLNFGLLRTIWALQPAFGVLECVSNFATQQLTDLSTALQVLGYRLQGRTTQVRPVRPVSSTRWTCRFYKFAQAELFENHDLYNHTLDQGWPTMQPPTLASVGLAPFLTNDWQDEHVDQLRWTVAEQELYGRRDLMPHNTTSRLIDIHGALPRPMHRSSSHAIPCPCGCSPALSLPFLQRGGGVFAVGVINSGVPCHLHPFAVANAMGAPANMRIASNKLRLCAALVGNAVPIPQGILEFATISTAMAIVRNQTPRDPHDIIMESIQKARPTTLFIGVFAAHNAHKRKRNTSLRLSGPFGNSSRMVHDLERFGDVGQLLDAEKGKLGLGPNSALRLLHNGHIVDPGASLTSIDFDADSTLRLRVYPLRGGKGCVSLNCSGAEAAGRAEAFTQIFSQHFDVIALQETHLTADGQKKFAATMSANHCITFGKPCEAKVRHVPPKLGRAGYVATQNFTSANGGVANLAKFPTTLVDTSHSDQIATQLYNTGAWTESFVPTKEKRTGFEGYYVGNLYAKQGQKNTTLFKQAQDAAIRNGSNIPYFLFGDMQTDIRYDPAWMDAFSTGVLIHVATALAASDAEAPTFCNALWWNKQDHIPGATNIDHIVTNKSGLSMLQKFWLLRDCHLPGHLPAAITFITSNEPEKAWVWNAPPPFPIDDYELDTDDAERANQLWDQYDAHFNANIAANDTESAWRLMCKVAEEFHAQKSFVCNGNKSFGRGRAPKFEFKPTSATVNDPVLGAALKIDKTFVKLVRQTQSIAKLQGWCETHGWRPVDIMQLEQKLDALSKVLAKLAVSYPAMLEVQLPVLFCKECADLMVQILTMHRVGYHHQVKEQRIYNWRLNMRRSMKTGGRAACRWIAALAQTPTPNAFRDPDSGKFTSSLQDMFSELAKIWEPIFNIFENKGNGPTWEHFSREFHDFIPNASTPELDPLEGERMFQTIQSLNSARAGGLDGWRTREVKALPAVFAHRFCGIMQCVENGSAWPRSFLEVPLPFLPKTGDTALDGRLLMLMSSWHAAWNRYRHADLSMWRSEWMPSTMCGGKQGSSITDVFWDVQLDLEVSTLNNNTRIALLLDRCKCFDRFAWPIMFGLQKAAGCPPFLVEARERWYCNVQSRFKMRSAFSEVTRRSNGGFQGCAFTIDDCNLLMTVWSNLQAHTCSCLTRNYFDDSTTLCNSTQEVVDLLEVDQTFDTISGQLLSETKSVAITSNPSIVPDLDLIQIGNFSLPVAPRGKLVGALVSTATGSHDLLDQRIEKAVGYLARVEHFPAGMQEKVNAIGLQAAAKVNVGLEITSPSKQAVSSFYHATKKAILGPGCRAWTAMGVLFSTIIKGHRISLPALQNKAVVIAAAKSLRKAQVSRDHWNVAYHSQKTHFFANGLVANFRAVAARLKWKWDGPFTLTTDWGWQFSLLHTPLSTVSHFVRDATRRAWLRSVSTKRLDMGGIAGHRYGIDADATCVLLRAQGKKKLAPLDRVFLVNFLTGAVHTQQRMCRAGFSQDTSELCRFCGLEPEDSQHIFYRCPCWESERVQFRDNVTLADLMVPPCTVMAGLVLQPQEIVDLYHSQVLDPVQMGVGAWDGTTIDNELNWRLENGRKWLLCATDGSCLNATHSMLARTGAGIFFCSKHPANMSKPVFGFPQSAQRGEVAALLYALMIMWVPTWFWTDSKYVCDRVNDIVGAGGALPASASCDTWAHFDLWQDITYYIHRNLGNFKVSWHPGHISPEDLDLGIADPLITLLNNGADTLAKAGARLHSPPSDCIDRALRRIEVAKWQQNMCINILQKRWRACPLPGREAGYSEHELLARAAGGDTDVQNYSLATGPSRQPDLVDLEGWSDDDSEFELA